MVGIWKTWYYKVVKQQKMNLNPVINHVYFHCARMTMNIISTSSDLNIVKYWSIGQILVRIG